MQLVVLLFSKPRGQVYIYFIYAFNELNHNFLLEKHFIIKDIVSKYTPVYVLNI